VFGKINEDEMEFMALDVYEENKIINLLNLKHKQILQYK
jgi:hypothetical protein